MYDLGRSLRERYGFLLPEHGMYTRDSTLVLSSASERCILTAQSLLASFYEPPKNAIDIPIRWQPVTVNVLKPEDDIVSWQFLLRSEVCLEFFHCSFWDSEDRVHG